MFCLGSLQSFASGLNHVSREMQIDTAPQASLVYDRAVEAGAGKPLPSKGERDD